MKTHLAVTFTNARGETIHAARCRRDRPSTFGQKDLVVTEDRTAVTCAKCLARMTPAKAVQS